MTNEQVIFAVLVIVGLTGSAIVRDFRKYLDAKIDPLERKIEKLEKLVRGY